MSQIESGIYEKGKFSLEEVINSIKRNPKINEAGAILSFSGIVRATSHEGAPVKGMKIDAYTELANKSINKICDEIIKREGIIDVVLIHFKGNFDITEDLVYVVVASAHRDEGFKALRDTVEMYKKEIAVWKKEEFDNGSSEWVH